MFVVVENYMDYLLELKHNGDVLHSDLSALVEMKGFNHSRLRFRPHAKNKFLSFLEHPKLHNTRTIAREFNGRIINLNDKLFNHKEVMF